MEIVVVLGALLVVFLIINWFFRLASAALRTVLYIAFVLLALWLVFGIGPDAIWEQIQRWISARR